MNNGALAYKPADDLPVTQMSVETLLAQGYTHYCERCGKAWRGKPESPVGCCKAPLIVALEWHMPPCEFTQGSTLTSFATTFRQPHRRVRGGKQAEPRERG